MRDVTVDQWEELVTDVRTEVKRAAEDADSPIMGAVLAELEEPTSDFCNAVVERILA